AGLAAAGVGIGFLISRVEALRGAAGETARAMLTFATGMDFSGHEGPRPSRERQMRERLQAIADPELSRALARGGNDAANSEAIRAAQARADQGVTALQARRRAELGGQAGPEARAEDIVARRARDLASDQAREVPGAVGSEEWRRGIAQVPARAL